MRVQSEYILNPDGSVYHLSLRPEDIADTIITVGDPDRVAEVSQHFDHIDIIKQKREFVTHTGRIGALRLSVLSTGIGAGNIDIALNELDALVNVDRTTGLAHDELRTLHLIRIGTSGSIHPDVDIDEVLVSQGAIGLDAVMPYYGASRLASFDHFMKKHGLPPVLHYGAISGVFPGELPSSWRSGITLSCPGFYAPQGRMLRLSPHVQLPMDELYHFTHLDSPMTNLEMETAPLFALAQRLGHEATSINCILAQRQRGRFSDQPQQVVQKTIQQVLQALSSRG